MRRVLSTFLCVFMFASGAWASCVEHAVLRDTDYFSSRYRWSNGKIDIKIWDSPSMVRIVGVLTPGSHVRVLDKSGNFLKVRGPDEQGGQTGWVSFALVGVKFSQQVGGSGAGRGRGGGVGPAPGK